MPYRKIPIIVGQTYHVFNRSIAREPIFVTKRDYKRVLAVIEYYSYREPGLRFSFYNRLPGEQSSIFLQNLREHHEKSVDMLAFSLMPNHVHFLIQEIEDNGIACFMSNIQN